MPRYTLALLFGLTVIAALAGGPEPKPKPQTRPQSQTAPATQPTAPIHPLLGRSSFVVDPKEIKGSAGLADKVGPITVSLNYYYDELPGLDLDKLSPERRKRVLERANTELCTCGCRGDTVARCLVKDPDCQLVKSLAKAIYEEERVRPLTTSPKP